MKVKTFVKSFIKKKPLRKASAKETFRESFIKAQSAMEYLMTYGWAILIISVVLAALFQLGVFNPMTFAPKAPPGSCQVFRPNGPGTTSFINLEGICSGELPRYAAQFNGVGTDINCGNSNTLDITGNTITIAAWIYVRGTPLHDIVDKEGQYGMKLNGNCGAPFTLEWDTSNDWVGTSYTIPNSNCDEWIFVAVTMNATTKFWYGNGQLLGTKAISGSISGNSNDAFIGALGPRGGSNEWFTGLISNVQIYNTTLSANGIQALYLEGIGGAPIDLQHLVAWWPLNGNANDYSGNGNNGVPTNVIFVSNWYNSYTPP
jgi:hypothetical protein